MDLEVKSRTFNFKKHVGQSNLDCLINLPAAGGAASAGGAGAGAKIINNIIVNITFKYNNYY